MACYIQSQCENSEQSIKENKQPIGRRVLICIFCIIVFFVVGFFGFYYFDSKRKFIGAELLFTAFCMLWFGLILFGLTQYQWSWGWPL
jgi:arginine exporter protein ArgO